MFGDDYEDEIEKEYDDVHCSNCGEPSEHCYCDNDEIDEDEDPSEVEPDESMDGDHESALASAGFGLDESYEHGTPMENDSYYDAGDDN
jgi:hypothetical protein